MTKGNPELAGLMYIEKVALGKGMKGIKLRGPFLREIVEAIDAHRNDEEGDDLLAVMIGCQVKKALRGTSGLHEEETMGLVREAIRIALQDRNQILGK